MKMKRHCLVRHGTRGFSLIESLITLFLFSVALLGLAAMYARGLSVSQGSYLRSLASIQATDMAERIRANPWAGTGSYALLSDDCQGLSSAGAAVVEPAAAVACDATGCSADQLAAWDLQQWCNANLSLFGGLFEHAGLSVSGSGYLITLAWKERVLQDNSQQAIETQSFTYRVQP